MVRPGVDYPFGDAGLDTAASSKQRGTTVAGAQVTVAEPSSNTTKVTPDPGS